MKFIELVLQNFGPYSGRQVINLDPKIDEENSRSIILIGGMNGEGKTTLMDAIRLALYGHRAQCSTRGNLSYGDFLTQCVNSHTPPNQDTRIELVFEHIENGEPVQYRIVRYWTKNPKDAKDNLGILNTKDETWPLSSLVNIWDEYIENLLPLGISNLFLFDGEQVKDLAEQDTPPSFIGEAIRSLLGLELVERLAFDIEILVNRKRKEMANAKDLIDLEEIEKKLKKQEEEKESTKNQLTKVEKQLQAAENEQKEAFNKFLTEGGKIASERNQLEIQQKEKISETNKVRQELCQSAGGALPLALIESLLTQVQMQGEKEFRIQQVQIAKNIILERDKRLIECISQLGISEDYKDKIQIIFEQESQSLQQEESANVWLFADVESLNQLYQLQGSLKRLKSHTNQQVKNLKSQEKEIEIFERKLQTAALPEDYQKLVDILEAAQSKLAERKIFHERIKHRLEKLESEVKETKKALQEYTKQNLDTKNYEHIIAVSTKVQQTLSLFRERLTLKKLNTLEEKVTECFRYLLHKSDLVHRIVIDTDTFGLSLYDLQGKMVPKHRLSAGEKQLLAIAFLWGLARVSGHQLPVAIDTPLGRLDSSHRTNLVERYFPSASHQVILLSTDTEIAEKEFKALQENDAIARKYLLQYNPLTRQTTVKEGYFW
ncbi:DNA sulfur modification protein DndD [Scytonema sp. UIC 10036]|uniref:DNA sulfur modification protein DndD n=1 Tax=Scytonema sp. UIC 10036 TaxID=2304196 RepID=UPI0012DA597B|nr:DNA sulfur modification protein DndD [Scytonema sp. UIC 10036]MUG92650.1 DNA sulfur modification protein DndD [Scytonema sp. UIC 10036]